MLTIDAIEQENATAEYLPLVTWLERPRGCKLLWIHRHFHVTGFELVHTAREYDAPVVNEHQISKDMLDLLHLVGRQKDGAAAIVIVVQQGIVEPLAIQDVKAERRLIQHEQPGVNSHY